MITDSFAAMGTDVIVVAESKSGIAETRSLFERTERLCSRFDSSSELTWVNAQPAGAVEVSADLAAILELAADLRHMTDGLVNPGVGARVVEWGYSTTFEAVGDLISPPGPRGSHEWTISERSVIRPGGVLLDLGGIAKGWTADMAIESGLALLVSAGGDMCSRSADTIAEIVDPADHTIAARVRVGIGALATSSVARRRWRVGDTTAHHLIDPRTGAPAASPVVSASVAATTASQAEAGAKAVLLHGEAGLAWADSQDWIEGAVVCWDSGAVYATGSLELVA